MSCVVVEVNNLLEKKEFFDYTKKNLCDIALSKGKSIEDVAMIYLYFDKPDLFGEKEIKLLMSDSEVLIDYFYKMVIEKTSNANLIIEFASIIDRFKTLLRKE